MGKIENKSEFELLRDDVSKLTSTIEELLMHQVEYGVGKLERAEASLEESVVAGKSWLEHKIKDKPSQSLGLAVAAGVLLGLMVFRRH